MQTEIDPREVEGSEDAAAETEFRTELVRTRKGEVRLARALARIHRRGAFTRSGCASAVEYAARAGMEQGRAAELLRAGLMMEEVPRAEGDVESGRVSAQAAGEIGRLFTAAGRPDPTTAREEAAKLVTKARTASLWRVRRDVRALIEAHAQGDRVVPVVLHVTETVRDEFQRAKTLASRKARRLLTDGETLAAITADYLDRHDPLRKRRRGRRARPTSERPQDRYVPAEVAADVLTRSGDECEFPGCNHRVFLQNAHRRPHARGGDRETDNLLRLCTTHHGMLDAGQIELRDATPEGAVFRVAASGDIVGPDPPKRPPRDESMRVSERSPRYRAELIAASPG